MTGLGTCMLSSCSDNRENKTQVMEEKRVSVRAVKAESGDIQSWVFAEGTARSVVREYLMFQNAGKVTYLKSDLREGSVVEKGTLLAQQDQRSLKADLAEAGTSVDVAQAELEQAKTRASLEQKTFGRYAKLLEQESASLQEYDEAKARADNAIADVSRAENHVLASKARLDQMQVRLEDTDLVAPTNGMIAYLNIKQGYYFMPNFVRTDSEEAALNTMPIVMIDPDTYEIAVDVPVYDRDRVKTGQAVLIQTRQSQAPTQPSSDDDTISHDEVLTKNRTGQSPPKGRDAANYIHGEVYSVNPAISPSGRSIQVEIHTRDKGMMLKDGMYVTVWIATENREDVVTAPLEAFLYRDNQSYVFTSDSKSGAAQLRKVTLGLRGVDRREVVSGIKPDEWVVTEGRYQLSHGTKIKIIGQHTPDIRETPSTEAVSGDE